MQPAGSGRASARASARGATGASSRASQRGNAEEEKKPKRGGRKSGGDGMVLVICGVVLLGLLGFCGAMYVYKTGEQDKARNLNRALKDIREENKDKAFQAFQKAMAAGNKFVKGEAPETTDEELFAPFRSDSSIYNVIYTRKYKDKKGKDTPDQRSMSKERLDIQQYSGHKENRDGVTLSRGRGTTEKQFLAVAQKYVNPAEGDKANLGGEIMVIVLAKEEPSPATE